MITQQFRNGKLFHHALLVDDLKFKIVIVFRFDPLPEAGQAKGLSLMLDSHSDLIGASSVPDDFQARSLKAKNWQASQILLILGLCGCH